MHSSGLRPPSTHAPHRRRNDVPDPMNSAPASVVSSLSPRCQRRPDWRGPGLQLARRERLQFPRLINGPGMIHSARLRTSAVKREKRPEMRASARSASSFRQSARLILPRQVRLSRHPSSNVPVLAKRRATFLHALHLTVSGGVRSITRASGASQGSDTVAFAGRSPCKRTIVL